MTYNALFSEQYLYIGGIACNGETTAQNTGWLDLKDVSRVAVGISPINMTVNGVVTVEQATSSAGAGAKTVQATGKNTTIESGDDAPTIIEIAGSELDAANDFRYLRITVTPASVSALTYALMVLGRAEELPAYTTDLERVVN